MTSALDGVRVVDLTGGVAGPVAGMLLADLGADVVKVYPPGGGPSRAEPGLHMWDRGKRSAVLDPSRPADLAALDALIGAADIVLVGTAEQAGIGYEGLRARGHSPGQPACWIVMPPYLLGETPWAGQQESAGLLSAWLGLAWNQASYDDVPVDCVFPLALHMQGIWAAITAVALLVGRQLRRQVAPLAVAGGAHGAQLVSPGGFATGLAEPHVHRPGGPGGALPNYRCYRCRDGQWLFFGAFTTAFIERGFRAAGADWILQDPRVGGDPDQVRLPRNLGWITRELEGVFGGRTRPQWLDLLDAADVPAAAVGQSADWLDHEQVRAIGLRAEVRNDAGEPIVMPGALIGLSQTPVTTGRAAQTRYPALADLPAGWSPSSGPVPARAPAPVPALAPALAPAPGPAPAPARDARGLASAGPPPGGSPVATAKPPLAGRPGAVAELPLAGLRVLNLGTIIAGPYAATLLGELGADVLKVERPPRGDEFRVAHGGRGGAGFSVYNRGQRSLLLDLTGAEGRDVFRRLVSSADVVVDNYRVGVLRRLGIDHDQLAAVNPAITSVSISAFGETGPLSQRPGFDPVVQAMSGIMRSQGGPDEADSPVFLTAPINDVLAAGLGALGACAALYARERIGRGQRVSVTLCASAGLVQSEHLVRFAAAPPMPAGGRDFAGGHPLDRLYRGADGWVRLGGRQPPDLPGLVRAGLAAADRLPTTALPATALPTTGPPTTALPATALPATALPATALPATAPPATPLPTTAPATTAPPATALPATALPATAPPATPLPATAPATTGPATTGPATTGPAADLPAVTAAIAAAVGRLPVSQILRLAAQAGIPAVRVRQAPELIADEQLIRHGLLTVVERGDEGVTQVGPGRWLEMPGLVMPPPGPAPAPGEHGQAILLEAGPVPR